MRAPRRTSAPTPAQTRTSTLSRRVTVGLTTLALAASGITAAYAVQAAQPTRDKALAAADAAMGVGTQLTSTVDELVTERTGVIEEGPGTEVDTSLGMNTDTLYYASYQKKYRGLRVVGADSVVTASGDGTVHDTSHADDRAQPTIKLASITPTIQADAAEKAAQAQVNAPETRQKPELVVHVDASGTPRLAWHVIVAGTQRTKPLEYGAQHHIGPWGVNTAIAPGSFAGSDGSTTTADEPASPTTKPAPPSVAATPATPSVLSTYVDASDGSVIESFDQVVDADEWGLAGSGAAKANGYHVGKVRIYVKGSKMKSTLAKGATCTKNGRIVTSKEPYGNGKATDFATGCVDALYAVEREVMMLKKWLGRNGIDGKGRSFPIKLGLNQANAFWDGRSGTFGRNHNNSRLATAMDVVAHEFGHGIFQFSGSANDASSAENGLNESTADIFGALTEHYANNRKDKPDYVVGESVNLSGNGPIRNMYNPGKLNDPNCYSNAIPRTEVHKAAGPQNHWFYLLAEGSNPQGKPASPTCNKKKVKGIGVKKAGKIFMSALNRRTTRLTHVQQRRNTLTAAKALFKGSCTEFDAVKAAWDAVSVPKGRGEPTCSARSEPQPAPSPPAPSTSGPKPTPSDDDGAGSGDEGPGDDSSDGDAAGDDLSEESDATPTMTNAAAPPVISTGSIMARMKKLVSITNANGGQRSSGSKAHRAMLDHIERRLKQVGYTVRRQRCTSGCSVASDNLIADYPGPKNGPLYLFGSHLDGVKAGPGTNDNGSGSMTLLTAALATAKAKPSMKARLRFAWWTDEEQGLNGSAFYARNMKAADKPKMYFNFDMTGSPNGSYFINNLGSAPANALKGYFDAKKIPVEENYEGRGRSDDASFSGRGIPASGFASGASSIKNQRQQSKWGGKSGRPYDACYHKACDTAGNINKTIITHAVNAVMHAIWQVTVK